MILGIDPGLSGGLGIYDGQIMFVADLPTFGTGTQRAVDCSALADIVRARGVTQAFVEAVHAMPKQGVSSSFQFGEALGAVRGVLGALSIPIHLVSPSRWKKTLGLTADKELCRRRAIELWPQLAGDLKRKADHNRVGLLIRLNCQEIGFLQIVRHAGLEKTGHNVLHRGEAMIPRIVFKGGDLLARAAISCSCCCAAAICLCAASITTERALA